MILQEKFHKPSGHISMYLHKGGTINSQGQCVGGELIGENHIKNLIVDTASVLMAGRMAPGAVTGSGSAALSSNWFDNGLQYLALGHGTLLDPTLPYDESTNNVDTTVWDLQNPPAETLTDTVLVGEGYRKEFSTWCFVDSAGNESTTETNILKITTIFNEEEANFPITEMGLFGGNANAWNNGAGKDTGLLFNHKVFKVWNKTSDSKLTIVWKLTF